MTRDDFKRQISGFRHGGRTCPCCRETTVDESRRLARHRLAAELRAELYDALPENRAALPEMGPLARRFLDVPPVHDPADITLAAAFAVARLTQ